MFEYVKAWLTVHTHSEKGQDLAEYALLIGLIAILAIAAVTALGGNINAVLNRIGTALNNAIQ
jgi:pilus assembly protein Flp/PilA